ncbi:MAG: hypothetical protein K2R98_10745 [Gemmataceae bacterium]|nr:hypothetical protein [Gemmataceae bacterium]
MLLAFGADEHNAENLVQDLCANVLQGALDNFDADQEFGRYLRTMVRNLYRSSLRRRQPAFTEDMLDPGEPGSGRCHAPVHQAQGAL